MSEPIVNPTREQMATLRGIIYGFRHVESGKVYIGQSAKSLKERYSYAWWGKVRNRHLRDALDRKGYEAFEVVIFEHSVFDPVELDRLEAEYIGRFNAYHPNGFNLAPVPGSDQMSEEYRDGLRHVNARTYRLKCVASGEVIEIHNLTEFCRERGIPRIHVSMLMKRGRGAVSHGFTLPETTSEDIANKAFYEYVGLLPPYTLWRDGVPIVFSDVGAFMKEHGLAKQSFFLLMRGRIARYKGFALTPESAEASRTRYRDIVLQCPNGERQRYATVTEFERQTGIHRTGLSAVVSGKSLTVHGMTLVSVERLAA